MKKIILIFFLCSMPCVNATDNGFIKRWVSEKLQNPSVTLKKLIDLTCLTADLVTTDQTSIISESTLLDYITNLIKKLSTVIDINKLEKFYIPYYLKAYLNKLTWYKQKKAEQKQHKRKSPGLLQLILV